MRDSRYVFMYVYLDTHTEQIVYLAHCGLGGHRGIVYGTKKNIGHLFSFGSRNRGKQKAFRLSKRQICFP